MIKSRHAVIFLFLLFFYVFLTAITKTGLACITLRVQDTRKPWRSSCQPTPSCWIKQTRTGYCWNNFHDLTHRKGPKSQCWTVVCSNLTTEHCTAHRRQGGTRGRREAAVEPGCRAGAEQERHVLSARGAAKRTHRRGQRCN